MEIEFTPLYTETTNVINNGVTTANNSLSAVVHYGEDPTDIVTPLYLVSVNYIRDYVSNFGDEITCTMHIPLGQYARLIYPNRLNLQVTLIKTTLDEVTDDDNLDSGIETELYNAVLLNDNPSPTVGQGAESNDIDALDLTQIVDVHFQLYNDSLEQIRVIQTGGIIRSSTVEDAILTTLTSSSQDIKVENEKAIEGIDMVDADNTDEKGQIVIPHGTRIIDLPDFIQQRVGVYNSGIGSYIQDNFWYIYPLFDTSHFEKRLYTLNIIILPKRKFSNIERTFQEQNGVLTILITGDAGFRDDNGTHQLMFGNGARFADASSLMDVAGNTSGNKTLIKRNKNNSEFLANKNIANGVNNAPVHSSRITSNPFKVYSELASYNGGMYKCVWENSDHSLIQPGMLAKINYVDEGGIQTLFGVVHVLTHISQRYSGFSIDKFKNQTILNIFVNNQVTQITT